MGRRRGSFPDAERAYAASILGNLSLGEARNRRVALGADRFFDEPGEEIQPAEKNAFRVDARFKEDRKRRSSGPPCRGGADVLLGDQARPGPL